MERRNELLTQKYSGLKFHSLANMNLGPCQAQWQPCYSNHHQGTGSLHAALCRSQLRLTWSSGTCDLWVPSWPPRAGPKETHDGGAIKCPRSRRGTAKLSQGAFPSPSLLQALCSYTSQIPFRYCQHPRWQWERKEETTLEELALHLTFRMI